MSQKNPTNKIIYDKEPLSRKFMGSSPSDATQTLQTFIQDYTKLLNKLLKFQTAAAKGNTAKDRLLYAAMNKQHMGMSNKQADLMSARFNMMHPDQNPFGMFIKSLRGTSSRNVRSFLNVKDLQKNANRHLNARQMAKMGVNTSNMLVSMFNAMAAGGASDKELKKMAKLWTSSKNMFMKKGMLKDTNGLYFNTVRQHYDENKGSIQHLRFNKKNVAYELQFYNYMKNLRKSSGGGGGGGGGDDPLDDLTDAIEENTEMLSQIGNWLTPFGRGFAGTPLGDIASLLGMAETIASQVNEAFDGNNLGEFLSIRGGDANEIFKNLFVDKETGASLWEFFGLGGRDKSTSNFITNPDGSMSLKPRGLDAIFGDKLSGFRDKIDASKFGKIFGLAMKTPVGPILGAVAGVGKILIGGFKFLAKHSPMLKAIEQLMSLFLTLFFMPFGNALANLLFPLMEGLINWVLKWNDLWTDFTWEKFGGLLWDMFSSLINWIISIPQAIFNLSMDVINFLLTSLPTLLANLFDALGMKPAADFFRNFGTSVGQGIQMIRDFVNNIYNSIKGFFSNPVAALQGLFTGITDSAGDAWGNFVSGFQGMLGLASGGIVQPTPMGTLALLAEGGEPEAVIPLSEFDNVFGGTQPIVVNINGDIYGMSDLESKIESVINRVSNRGAYR